MGKKRVIKKGGEGSNSNDANKPKGGGEGRSGHRMVRGIAHIEATYNNTLISISDEYGNVIGQSSAGAIGFSGTKKATPFAAARVAEAVVEKVRRSGLQEVIVRVKGVGSGRDSAVRSLANQGLTIVSIKDITPLPHNGPRAKKVRRV
jgi:small subunit ribosomal protein S11